MITKSGIEKIAEEAQLAFWSKVVDLIPNATSGDFGPGETFAFNRACEEAVRIWVMWNYPRKALAQMAARADPRITGIEWGSEEQSAAENKFFEAVEAVLSGPDFAELESYCMKATTEERLDEALRLLECESEEDTNGKIHE